MPMINVGTKVVMITDNQDSSFSSDTRETSSNSVSAASFTDTPARSTSSTWASTTPEQDLVEDAGWRRRTR